MSTRYVKGPSGFVALGGGGTWSPKPVTSWSSATNVTADTAAHTKGAWTQLVASTPAAADCIDIAVGGLGFNGANWSSLIDIGVGGSGAETAVVSNVACGGANIVFSVDLGWAVRFAVYIPAGSRISARIQTVVAGGQIAAVKYRLGAGPNPSATSTTTTTIGSSTGTSGGTATSATINTYVELAASTAATYSAVTIVPSLTATSISGKVRELVLGVGAAAAEVAVASMATYVTSAESVHPQGPNQIYLGSIASGSRLAVSVPADANTQFCCCLVATEVLGV